jgi:hypothetical protein
MQLAYEECPILAGLPLVTEGFICVGTPVDPVPFVRSFMAECLTTLAEFQKLLSYPYPHFFFLFVCFCCNLNIIHLLRHLGLQILDSVHQFNASFDQLADDFHLQSHAHISLQDIPTNQPSFPFCRTYGTISPGTIMLFANRLWT